MLKIIFQHQQLKTLVFEDVLNSRGRCKIIKILVKESEVNITKIVNSLHMNYNSVLENLRYFVKIGFIEEKNFGRIRIFRFKEENLKARALKNLILFWENETGDLN